MIQLTAPRILTFLISLALIGVVAASFYLRIPIAGRFVTGHRLELAMAAYAILALGVVTRGL